jgi:hypothetical protein
MGYEVKKTEHAGSKRVVEPTGVERLTQKNRANMSDVSKTRH